MPERPWLSVLVPVFNAGAHLEPCLRSVLSQADQGVELLLLDDASTDGSAAHLRAAAAAHPRTVRVLAQDRNRGEYAARNRLVAEAAGRHQWFLDADDRLLPGSVASLRAILRAHDPDVVVCDYRVDLQPGASWRARLRAARRCRVLRGPSRTLQRDPAALVSGLMATSRMHAWSKVVRGALARSVRYPAARALAGLGTMPRLAAAAQTWWYEPAAWIGYRRGHASVLGSASRLLLADERMQALEGLGAALEPLVAARPALRTDLRMYLARHFVLSCTAAHRADPSGAAARVQAYRQTLELECAGDVASLPADCLRRGDGRLAWRCAAWLRRASDGPLPRVRPLRP